MHGPPKRCAKCAKGACKYHGGPTRRERARQRAQLVESRRRHRAEALP